MKSTNFIGFSLQLHLRRRNELRRGAALGLEERIIGVSLLGAAEERRAVIAIQWRAGSQPMRQVRICDECAAKRDCIDHPGLDGGAGRSLCDAAPCNNGLLEPSPERG